MEPTTLGHEQLDWQKIPIQWGDHKKRAHGVCAMELVAWMAGEPHSSKPKSSSRVITKFVARWNDDLRSDEERELLRPVLPYLIGTAGTPEVDHHRKELCLDWMVYDHLISWMRLVPTLSEIIPDIAAYGWRSHKGVELMLRATRIAWPTAWIAGWPRPDMPEYKDYQQRWKAARKGELATRYAGLRGAKSAVCASNSTYMHEVWAAALCAEAAASRASLEAISLNTTIANLQKSALNLITQMAHSTGGGK